jgi:hypothetical protein
VPAVRSLLARVARLEQARAPVVTPFERAFGSLDRFAAKVRADMAAGTLDPRDGPDVIAAIRQWHDDWVWEVWP